MNSTTIFIFLFVLTFIYYLIQKKYDFAIISFLLILHLFFINNRAEYYSQTSELTSADNETLTNFLNGNLTVSYLNVTNNADICGVTMTNGSINSPNIAAFGDIAFMNGSISIPELN